MSIGIDSNNDKMFQNQILQVNEEQLKINSEILKTLDAFRYELSDYLVDYFDQLNDDTEQENGIQNETLSAILTGNKQSELIAQEKSKEDEEKSRQLQQTLGESQYKLGVVITDTAANEVNAINNVATGINNLDKTLENTAAAQAKADKAEDMKKLVGNNTPEVVKPTEDKKKKPKKEQEFNMKQFMDGFGKIMKTLFNPLAMVVTFVAEFLPWILIFGSVLLGFLKKATLATLAKIAWWIGTRVLVPILAFVAVANALKFAGMFVWKAFGLAIKKSHLYHMATEFYRRNLIKLRDKFIRLLNLDFLKKRTAATAKTDLAIRATNKQDGLMSKLLNIFKTKNAATEHAANMATTKQSFLLKLKSFVADMANKAKEALFAVKNFIMNEFVSAKKALFDSIHAAHEEFVTNTEGAFNLTKFIRSMALLALKIVQAIAVFAAEFVRIAIQIAMTAIVVVLVIVAIAAIIAIIAGMIYLVIKALIWIFELVVDVLKALLNPFGFLIDAFKSLFSDEEDEKKKDDQKESQKESNSMDQSIENVQSDYFTKFCDDALAQLKSIDEFVGNIKSMMIKRYSPMSINNNVNNQSGVATVTVSSLTVTDSVKVENNQEENNSTTSDASPTEVYNPSKDLQEIAKYCKQMLDEMKSHSDWS